MPPASNPSADSGGGSGGQPGKTKKKLGYTEIPDILRKLESHPSDPLQARRRQINIVLGISFVLSTVSLVCTSSFVYYYQVVLPARRQKELEDEIHAHAAAAALRAKKCEGIDWQTACDALSGAGARRVLSTVTPYQPSQLEENALASDDPAVTYDNYCLRIYRLQFLDNITFPYHASQLLAAGGNQTMALFIQHGAMRDAQDYFCSFKKLMLIQKYRPFDDILIIAPDFQYGHDALVHPQDAFWNSSKPWGDWRVGAESDPKCCGNSGRTGYERTVSSFEVLDHMLAVLTDKQLFPRMNKISYVGHSAGM